MEEVEEEEDCGKKDAEKNPHWMWKQFNSGWFFCMWEWEQYNAGEHAGAPIVRMHDSTSEYIYIYLKCDLLIYHIE